MHDKQGCIQYKIYLFTLKYTCTIYIFNMLLVLYDMRTKKVLLLLDNTYNNNLLLKYSSTGQV